LGEWLGEPDAENSGLGASDLGLFAVEGMLEVYELLEVYGLPEVSICKLGRSALAAIEKVAIAKVSRDSALL
jgi:hypothetical protein